MERLVEELRGAGIEDAPMVRLSPGRTIVQLGPVALTLTWLRSTLGHVSDGELLVVVWRGAVHPSRKHEPERRSDGPATFATTLWEDTLSVEAADEQSWRWRGAAVDGAAWTSTALAERCVERLQQAYHAELQHG